jgi:protein-tyrosine kinase
MGVIESALEKLRRNGTGPNTLGERSPSELQSWAAGPEPTRLSNREIVLNRNQLRAAGYLPEFGHELRFADYYREIKRPIIRRAVAANAPPAQRLILVTSALPGEGKTFTSLNLALSMARERDLSVLLIDADFPKSHIGRALGMHDEPGLLDALADEALDVESLILRTNVKGLEFLSGGRAHGAAAELVASSRMKDIAIRLAARNPHRLVLFDSGPLLASSEARAFIHIPGQVVLVARAGKTPRQALLDAISHIDKKALHGLVLNDAYITNHNSYYGYSRDNETNEAERGAE